MLPSLGYFSEEPCVFFLSGSCNRPYCHFRHCARDKTADEGKASVSGQPAKEPDAEWLGPNLRLAQVTRMIENAVDRAILAYPDKKLDRASMITKALETLRKESLETKTTGHKNAQPNPSTSSGFPTYRPTPISVLNKRHIPVAAMPDKPMVVRKSRPDDKPLVGTSSVVSAPPVHSSHIPKPDAPPTNPTANVELERNASSDNESSVPLIQQISAFLGTEMSTDSTSTKTASNERQTSPLLSQATLSNSDYSKNASVRLTSPPHLKEGVSQDSYTSAKFESDNITDQSCDANDDLLEQENDDLESVGEPETAPSKPDENFGVIDYTNIKESATKVPIGKEGSHVKDPSAKSKNHEHRHDRSSKTKSQDVQRDAKKSTHSHSKSEKSVRHSSKHKDSKSEHKTSDKEKNGDDGHGKEKPIKDSERESCDKKPSLHHANFPKKCQKKDDKNHQEKRSHHKSHDKESKHKDNPKTEDSDNHKKRSHDDKSKSSKSSKHSSSSSHHKHSKSGNSDKHSSSHSSDRDKVRKRKADEESGKHAKIAKVHNGDEKAKHSKSDTKSTSQSDGLGSVSRRNSDSHSSKTSIKRKHQADSDNDVDFVDSLSPDRSAIVISSSSADEFQDDCPSQPASNSDEEGTDDSAQPSVVNSNWLKAKEKIQRSSNSKFPRIAHVPNVMNILTAKNRLLTQELKPPPKPVIPNPTPSTAQRSNENDEGPQPKITKRIAHGSQGAESRPVIKHIDNVKLPPGIRQHYCNVFYDELCKYLDPEKAKRLAVEEEMDVAKRCRLHKIYQNNCTLLLLKIRKTKGNIGKDEQSAEKWTGTSTPDFTYGLTLYKCFEKYLVPDEELMKNGYAMPLPGQPTCAYIEKSARKYSVPQPDEPFKRRCANCRKTYEIDQNGMPTTSNDCNYHWGRMRKVGGRSLQVEKYTCCDGGDDALPCQSNVYHVWSGKNEDCIPGFVKTKEWPSYKDDSSAGVYALDCEMCYTTRGLELARLTVIDLNEAVIFDEVVALDNPVLDYCTRFSGIDESKMRQATLTFQDVQNWVLDNFFDKTILVGHSLENDLNALKVFHKRIVDTSITFPHKYGPPMKNSLKNLAMSMLALPIQENESGHDSKEDAVACLKLMMKRIKEDAKVRKPRVIIGYGGKKR